MVIIRIINCDIKSVSCDNFRISSIFVLILERNMSLSRNISENLVRDGFRPQFY